VNVLNILRTALHLASVALLLCMRPADNAFAQATIPAVATYHNDPQRTGQNLQETILTPANVNSTQFGKLFSYPVDGQLYTQPLYVPGVTIPGKGVHNVVYVTTEADSVYAFDADNAAANPAPLWYVSFAKPPKVVAVPANCNNSSCTIQPTQGITGTPVISTENKTIYLVARTQETTTAGKLSHAGTGGDNYGDSVVKLHLTAGATKGTYRFTVEDYFTPSDQECRSQNDADLGSGRVMVLPTQTGPAPHELLAAGKGNPKCDSSSPIELVNTQNVGKLGGQVQSIQGSINGYFATPAYWEPASGRRFIYLGGLVFAGLGDYLRQYSISKGNIDPATSIAESPEMFKVGATPSVSANGGTNGIVWAIERPDALEPPISVHPSVLRAYDARNIATELYNSNMNPTRDAAAPANKFAVPTVVNGKVYVGNKPSWTYTAYFPKPMKTATNAHFMTAGGTFDS